MRVAQAIVPEICGDSGEGDVQRRHGDGVQVVVIITAEDHLPRSSILDREANIVKLNVNWIVTS